ncbi:hypothetical protein [Roseburia faecis]|uniref:hypothetical protein n=1 Tax=Roseburia faecis TaxID=301302 RepID=UPI003F9E5000
MIIKNDTNIDEFFREIKSKKLYCYGAGNVFRDFLLMYSDVDIYYVIDKQAERLKNKFPNIDFLKPEEFLQECDAETSVLLITCLDYIELEKKLQIEESLRNLSCYAYCMMQRLDSADTQENDTNKYQLTEFRFQDYMAGQKAPADVTAIASKIGYKTLMLNRGTVQRGMTQTEQSWKNIAERLKDNTILLIQLPLLDDTRGIYEILKIKKKKNIKVIAIIHDVNVVRGNPTESDYKQYEVLKDLPDVFIVHNKNMMQMLCEREFDINRMVNLEIFDYLISDYKKLQESEGVIIAGNLIETKAAYVYQINKIKDVKFNLFGANYYSKEKFKNISYYGAFLPDDLINNLQGKYGLVWDGDSIETCSGGKGEYLRINNPHKLSLYLAVGIPVIIWDEAAEAEFVIKEHVGITVESLYELPDKLAAVSDSEYENMKHNAEAVGERLRRGEYMTNAIRRAENLIKGRETNSGV